MSTDASVDVAVRRIVLETVGLVIVEDVGEDGLGVEERDVGPGIRGLDRLDKVAQSLVLAAIRATGLSAQATRALESDERAHALKSDSYSARTSGGKPEMNGVRCVGGILRIRKLRAVVPKAGRF